MAQLQNLLQKVRVLDQELFEELVVELKRAGSLSSHKQLEEIEFLLKNELISKLEALKRTHPEKEEEVLRLMLLEKHMEQSDFQLPIIIPEHVYGENAEVYYTNTTGTSAPVDPNTNTTGSPAPGPEPTTTDPMSFTITYTSFGWE